MGAFRFKQFSVKQDKCAMKLGTDSVLLGAWASVGQASSILDIGTGTGVLALMAAQRNPHALVHAVELDQAAATQAQENFEASPWAARLTAVACALQDYAKAPLLPCYDALICNPPYYPPSEHTAMPASARSLARQAATLDFQTLINCAEHLLNPEGCWSLILPSREAKTFLALLQAPWSVRRRIEVLPRVGKQPNRELLELCLQECTTSQTGLIALRQGPTSASHHEQYTKAFRALHRDFLLFL